MKRYDAIVVGGGPGGYVCALRLAKNGRETLLIEREEVGGTCLNHGCIPTKSLLGSAAAVNTLSRGDEFGFTVGEVLVDYGAAHARSREAVGKLVGGLKGLLKKNRVDVAAGTARFQAAKTLGTGEGRSFSARDIVIATGSRHAQLPVFAGLGADVLSPRDALALTRLPGSIVIVGAGAIGVEFAWLWSAYGVKVTVIEAADRILPSFDPDTSALIARTLNKRGVGLYTSARITASEKTAEGIAVTLGGKRVEAEKLLVSAGVRPATGEINAGAAGIETDERGCIPVDGQMRTRAEGIYAIGDVTGLLPLAHTASAQGLIAADTICAKETEALDYNRIPRCVYGAPEAAMVGRTQAQLAEESRRTVVSKYFFSANGKAIGEGETDGFVKVIAAEDTKEILGVHMAGPHVSELIAQCVTLMKYEVTADEVERIVFPHPSLSEVVMEALNGAGGNGVHQ